MFLALANISVLRNWCFLHLHTRTWHVTSLVWVGWVGGGDVNVRCTCTHLGATQLMFLALANISVLRNWCFLHLHTRTWHVTSLVWVGWGGGGGMLTYVALAHISVLRNWCFLHLHTSRCYATDVSCTCKHLGTAQLMFLALAHTHVARHVFGMGGVGGGGGDVNVRCTCTHLGATQLMFLALAHISVLRNWCFLHLQTSRYCATDVSCTCTHARGTSRLWYGWGGWGGGGMLTYVALAHISVLRNWCFLHLQTSRYCATDVSCTCTHARGTSRLWYGWGGWGGGGMLTYVALAHISVLRNWCFLHLHTSRCYATDVSCTCKHLGTAQLMFLALARISVLRNWCFLHLHTVVRVSNNVRVSLEQAVDVTWTMDAL